MPVPLPATDIRKNDPKTLKSTKFADIKTLIAFPRNLVTSSMVPLSSHDESFIVSCLGSQPLAIVQDSQIHLPRFEKNDLIPLKPIQNLKSLAEHSGCIVLAHGNHNLEFGKLFLSDNGSKFTITRFCQRAIDQVYKKIRFTSNSHFIGINDSRVELYDFNRITQLKTITSRTDIQDFDVCLHNPSIMAYTNGNINIADMRDPTTTLYKQESRSSVVGWNPIVPYWLATATPSKIQIFDIRYTSANPMVSIQHSNVNELCWSPNNCDLLLAASKDRRINLWSLRNGYEDESRLSMAMNRFELGSLCTAPNSSKNVFYGLDDVDSIISLKIDPDFLSSIAPTTNQDPEHREIEGALYSSDFTYFMEKITTLSREAVESGNYAKLKQLIQLTMPIKSDSLREFDENIISSIEMTSKAAFDQLLLQGTKQNYLNFKASLEDCASIAKEKEIQTFIDQMRLKIRVVELIASGDYCTLKNFINSLIESYIHDYNFLDNENSIKLVALIFLNDRRAGLQFVKAISSSFTVGTPEIVQIWHWIALYPTIFDASSFEVIKNRPSLSRSIGNMNEEFVSDSSVFLDKLRKHKYSALLSSPQLGPQNAHLVQQVHLNIGTSPKSLQNLFAIEEALNCSPQDSSAIENMRGKLLESCEMDLNTALLSAESIKAILEGSLKPTRPIEEFFQLAFRLQVLTENTPIVGAIRDFVTSVGMSRLKLQINQAKQVQTSPETTKKTIKAVLAIGTDPYCNLSEDQMNYLIAQLSDFQGFEDFPPLPMEGNHIGFNIQIQMIKNNKQK